MPPSAEPSLTLLFVDDHPLYREGFRAAVTGALPGVEVRLAVSGEAALDLIVEGLDVDLCLSDLRLPGISGLALLEGMRLTRPDIARALLCADLTPSIAGRARELGCIGCLSKLRDLDAMAQALKIMLDGVEIFDANPAQGPCISDRRRRLLELAADGQSNKQIARSLHITERTVKDHWSAIFTQMGVSRRTEAVSHAQRLRLI